MHLLQKLVSFTMFVSLLIFVLPFVSSSQEQVRFTGNHSNNKAGIHEISPKLLFEITLHGFLLWASMGFLIPVGILTIRMSNREECGRRVKILFYVHAVTEILSTLLATVGAAMSIKNFDNSFNNHHQRLGLVLYSVIWLRALLGFLRPQRGSKGRSVWFVAHWLLGISVALLGVINVYTGLQAYHEKTSRRIKPWTILFTIEISFFVFFYLLQDKWVYVKKQGVILGTEPVAPKDLDTLREKGKELVTEHC
ncbi:hypothetical protein SLA2020_300140 [Shorea laevis]